VADAISFDDAGKVLRIKMGQGKKDDAAHVAHDVLKTGKYYRSRIIKRKVTGQDANVL
jgi:hypothetical protein